MHRIETIRQILTAIYILILFVSSIVGLTKLRQLDKPFYLLTLLLMITTPSELMAEICNHIYGSNAINAKIYLTIHIPFFGAIYYSLFKDTIPGQSIPVITVSFLTVAITYNFLDPSWAIPFGKISVESFLLMCYSTLYFFKLFRNPADGELSDSSKLWFNGSVLIYFASAFVIFSSLNYIFNHKLAPLVFDIILNLLNIFHYSLFGIALHLYKPKPSPIPDGQGH